jgi:hypothetical protein
MLYQGAPGWCLSDCGRYLFTKNIQIPVIAHIDTGAPMPKTNLFEDLMETPEKREKLYTWILTAQILVTILIVVGGIFFILLWLGVI